MTNQVLSSIVLILACLLDYHAAILSGPSGYPDNRSIRD
ncbi:hypothetical protein FHR70_002221 [Microvirga lupini]|uniref:Uncharacterized protein n=1 Tax=Microvirga lupini TaxID=420324 RepID=A0A7W4VL27_9HYPH|nr:hypothetical protein [Microvirga lupini]